MLHDPRRDVNIVAFRDYAASKDPNETYDYLNNHSCACAQFARHIGLFHEWDTRGTDQSSTWEWLNTIARGHVHSDETRRWTWGALTRRLDCELHPL